MIFNNILRTAGTRILNALFNLAILLLITNFIGSKGFGVISLIVLDVTVIQLFMGLLAGGSLIYFASRSKTVQLLLSSYLWIIFIALVFSAVGWMLFNVSPSYVDIAIPKGFGKDILLLGLLNGFMQIHYNLLIGQKRIPAYNLIFTVQITLFLLLFLFEVWVSKQTGPEAYIIAMYVSWSAGSLLGFYAIVKEIKDFSFKGWRTASGKILRYGLPTQSAVMLHIGNKRMSFYFIRIFAGLSPLGIYSAGVQLTEGLRLIGQSISLVQYSVISNSNDKDYARTLSIRLMKFTLLLTLFALLVLLAIPQHIYQLVFSQAFGVIKTIVLILSPGVLALAANTIFSHYFSGVGKPAVNLHANIIGFVFALLFAFLLIPPFGYIGAAATASLNYLASVIYQYIVFKKQTQTRFSEWIPRKVDLKLFIATIKQHANKQGIHEN
jgi:O-antigen/teichoic acid export membrane protein